MKTLSGYPASSGIVVGPSYLYQSAVIEIERRQIAEPEAEWARLEQALTTADEQLEGLQLQMEQEASADEAAIFAAHRLFLKDPTLLKSARAELDENQMNIESAWFDATEIYASQMEALEDEYFRARAADIRDVANRVLRILIGIEAPNLGDLGVPSVIIAQDLTPSDTASMDKNLVLAFCTAEGGPTSHTAILAKALSLPAVVGIGPEVLQIPTRTLLAVDGAAGEVIIDPDEASIRDFTARGEALALQSQEELSHAFEVAITTDGVQVEVVANVGSVDDTRSALEHGAEGIGLLRTEFLYLERDTAPDEQEQFEIYSTILDMMEQRPVVVRTLDVGGDKELAYIDLGQEANPFLGWRAIRMCLDEPNLFAAQLRALLKAGVGHDLRIMFPMISNLEEVRQAKQCLHEAAQELEARGESYAEQVQVGIMVEVPSVAVLADRFALEVDFFSIGTNDLTQYTMAAERTNERVAHLGDACHPAILRQIKHVIEEAHKQGIWVGLCGELAGDPSAVPILLGLGLDEFSMSPGSIPHAKTVIRTWSKADARRLALEVLDFDSARQVREYVKEQQPF
jgi:phosphoenolpyruvate-protein phosphotransferase